MTNRITMAQSPKGLLDGLVKTEFFIKKTGMDLRLIELIKYRVSQINGCAYCLDMHHREALQLGESELRLHTVIAWKECPYFTGKERAALHLAEALTKAQPLHVSDELYNELLQHFTPEEIAVLTVAIATINSWNRLNITFGSVPTTYAEQTPASSPV